MSILIHAVVKLYVSMIFYKNIAIGSQDEFLKQINFDMYGRSLSTNPANRRHIFTSVELLRAINVTQPQPMIFSFFHTF